MAHLYPDTPRTAYGDGDQSRLTTADLDLDMSIEPSFHSPSKHGDDLVRQMRGQRTPRGLKTPSAARNPLVAARRPQQQQPSGKPEFTPLLRSAMKNRISSAYDRELGAAGGAVGNPVFGKAGVQTPAALKPGYKFDNSPLPEGSSMYDGSSQTSITELADPAPHVPSSSFMSTPMALPRSGEMDRGNMLTLREQEAKIAQIDKDNFGPLQRLLHVLELDLHLGAVDFEIRVLLQGILLEFGAGASHVLLEEVDLELQAEVVLVDLGYFCFLLAQGEHVPSIHLARPRKSHGGRHETAARHVRGGVGQLGDAGLRRAVVHGAALGQRAVVELVPGLERGGRLHTGLAEDGVADGATGGAQLAVVRTRYPVLHGAPQQRGELGLAGGLLLLRAAGGDERVAGGRGRLEAARGALAAHLAHEVVAVLRGRVERRLDGHVQIQVGRCQARLVAVAVGGARRVGIEMRHGAFGGVLLLGI
ncbi:hypothetical protein BK809_0000085 [Diplodia seriata]|uniref:Uncharacterized protein n=1 Tax=Diplodia seriata TaxID=420778 RepID=A0A1S8B9R7_9PEZI|nr:hypothetical protein BK809_0000085 [Diplodia seriata]